MHVAVDTARQHQHAGRVHDFLGGAEVRAQRRDLAAGYADIAGKGIGGGGDGSATDNGIEAHAVS